MAIPRESPALCAVVALGASPLEGGGLSRYKVSFTEVFAPVLSIGDVCWAMVEAWAFVARMTEGGAALELADWRWRGP